MSEILQPPPAQESVISRSEPREWHFQDILPMLYRRRRVAVTTFLVVAAAVVAYTLSATPVYEAHAELLLDEKPSIVTFEGSANASGDPKGYLETQHRILRSRSLARRVIDELDLWKTPGFVSTGRETPDSAGSFLNGWRRTAAESPRCERRQQGKDRRDGSHRSNALEAECRTGSRYAHHRDQI